MRFFPGIMTTLTLPTPKRLVNCRCFLIETNSLPTTSSPGDRIASSSSSKREIHRTSSASLVDSRQASSSSSSHTGYRTRLFNMRTAKNARDVPPAGGSLFRLSSMWITKKQQQETQRMEVKQQQETQRMEVSRFLGSLMSAHAHSQCVPVDNDCHQLRRE